MRITKSSGDPQQPGQTVGGLSQLPCADADCAVGFIGDYFGLAISGGNIYALFVSTHYPSDVTADGGGRVYYQQQVLATVPRPGLRHRLLRTIGAHRRAQMRLGACSAAPGTRRSQARRRAPVASHRGPRVRAGGGLLYIAQWHPGIKTGNW